MPASLEGVGGHRDNGMGNGHGECEVRDAALEVSNSRDYCQKLPLAFFGTSVSRRMLVQTRQTPK